MFSANQQANLPVCFHTVPLMLSTKPGSCKYEFFGYSFDLLYCKSHPRHAAIGSMISNAGTSKIKLFSDVPPKIFFLPIGALYQIGNLALFLHFDVGYIILNHFKRLPQIKYCFLIVIVKFSVRCKKIAIWLLGLS